MHRRVRELPHVVQAHVVQVQAHAQGRVQPQAAVPRKGLPLDRHEPAD
jgi:hypothetical protein